MRQAFWDLDTARILHRERRFNAAAFYAHQAAEKACKAPFYYVHEAPWSHSVRELLLRYFRRLHENPPEDLMTYVRELDRHYIPSRYPNAHPSGTSHEAYDEETSKRALEACEKLISFVRKITGIRRAHQSN